MTPVRVLLVGDRPRLLDRMRVAVTARSLRATTNVVSSKPSILLNRTQPELLVLQVPTSSASIEAWRRGIERYRDHRPLSVIALLSDTSPALCQLFAEMVADAGRMTRPYKRKKFCRLLDRWMAESSVFTGDRAA